MNQLEPGGEPGTRDVQLWFFTDRIQELFAAITRRQFRAADEVRLGADAANSEVRFEETSSTPFYGGRQFSVRDINGLSLIFWQPEWMTAAT